MSEDFKTRNSGSDLARWFVCKGWNPEDGAMEAGVQALSEYLGKASRPFDVRRAGPR